ncbi:MAG: hypothetical protein LBQ12_04315, partial [Deltaproteobacteria bacterium]|nr:hypothetical protein [Deltaproteobacteria bacterium]
MAATGGRVFSGGTISYGGTGTLHAEGITVTAQGSGKAEVSAEGTTQSGSISGRAEVNAGDGAISVTSGDDSSGRAVVEARGGGFTPDALAAEVSANGISVISYGADARVGALAGDGLGAGPGGEIGGGSARVSSSDGISVLTRGTVPATGEASVLAEGSGGISGTAGGRAEVSSGAGIDVSGAGSGGARVAATGGDAAGAEGGEASVRASGSLTIQAGDSAAGVVARGGESLSGANAGGAAAVTGDGILVTGSAADAKTASLAIRGGASQDGLGGSATLNSTGSQGLKDVAVAARVGGAVVEIVAGEGDTGGDDWDGALLQAKNLAITAAGAGNALVQLEGGGGGLSGKGGEASVRLEGSLTVSGAEDAAGGSLLVAVTGALPGAAADLSVKNNLTVAGGDAGASSDGGDAAVIGFTSVALAEGRLEVRSGADFDGGVTHTGGATQFQVGALKAREIELSKSGSGQFEFSADALD